jgi:chemotaxis signal transduction protein
MNESDGIEAGTASSTPDWLGLARSASTNLNQARGEGASELLRELLVIGLNGSPYAIAVERVREIVRMRSLTRVPRAPNWLLGVVALRGEVVEIVDLRRRLGLEPTAPDRSSRIIVLHGDGDRVTGVLVDSVSDVYRVSEDSILPADDLELSAVVEMCPRGDEFISILDVDRFLGFTDG